MTSTNKINYEDIEKMSYLASLQKFYKLDYDVCKSRSNRNCSNNARCLKGLHQPSWLINSEEDVVEDNNNLINTKLNNFCGLKNLGATCYINTFLQLWFHNVTLRKSIYNWRPNNFNQSISTNPIMSLQLVLSMMQFSKRPSVDPTQFIKCLQLDESQEQDTHEFSNLFISYIQTKLNYEHDKSIQNTINKQYCMKIAYIIKCNKCNFISERESDFYELLLRVKGFKDVEECISDYLKEECLEGTNKYACQICDCLQDAKRFIELRKLPPVLNLQLLRFEASNGLSRKISSFLKFPNRLNMNNFVKKQTEINSKGIYNLFAVLIHEGQTAHSGHYITFIKKGNTWFKFNDENVEELKDFNLKIDSDDDFSEIEKKSNTIEKGYHKSKNAYMLVYKEDCEDNTELPNNYIECNLPQYLIDHIETDNESYLNDQKELLEKKSLQRTNELNHQKHVKKIYSEIDSLANEHQFDIISKNWLVSFFEANVQKDVVPVDNSNLLCKHKKLDMNATYKCISKSSADLIYSLYGGGPRIQIPDFYCDDCVKYKIHTTKLKQEIDNDSKEISTLLKFKNSNDEKMFWIGKESFKKWKQIKLNLVKSHFAIENECDDNNLDIEKFNQDLLCQHGNLCSDVSKRRLVRELVWKILFRHFPDSPQFEENSSLCTDCLEIDKNNQLIRDKNFSLALTQRSSLKNLFNSQECRYWSNLAPGELYHILSTKFYIAWKKFLLHPNTAHSPGQIVNDCMLCDSHSKFLFPPSQEDFVGFDKKYIILNDKEWNVLYSFYNGSNDITVNITENGIQIDPEFCNSCFLNYIQEEKRKRFVYSNVSIYIHKVYNEDSPNNSDSSNNDNVKKFKKSDYLSTDDSNNICIKNFDVPRRSLRRRRYKNELEIKVSSTDKLKDIKFKIMQHFNVATYDQTLIFNNRQLSSQHNNFTLAELEVEPYSVIVLKVDDNTDENTASDGYPLESSFSTEGGFKGTQLQFL